MRAIAIYAGPASNRQSGEDLGKDRKKRLMAENSKGQRPGKPKQGRVRRIEQNDVIFLVKKYVVIGALTDLPFDAAK